MHPFSRLCVFLAIGHRPNTDLFQGVLQFDAQGYILPAERTMTTIAGVFAAGDVADPHYRQAITAAADGSRAAMDARRWLERQPAGPLSSTPRDQPAALSQFVVNHNVAIDNDKESV